jgi:hypothetical protein
LKSNRAVSMKRLCPERARGGMIPLQMAEKCGGCLIAVAAMARPCHTEHE